MIEEAVKRMNMLNQPKSVINAFVTNGTIYQHTLKNDFLIRELPDEEALKAIEESKNHGSLPFLVIVNDSPFGKMYSVLTVSPYKEDWEMEQPIPFQNSFHVVAYVHNADNPDCTEMGSIYIEEENQILYRVDII